VDRIHATLSREEDDEAEKVCFTMDLNEKEMENVSSGIGSFVY
jgi:hypothetical protein